MLALRISFGHREFMMGQPIDREDQSGARHGAGTYQMLWDCRFCGTEKLLGITHRHCPNCGAAQDPAWRYFPAEADMVAVEDHQYVGTDVICPACSQPNSAASTYCSECGADLATGQAAPTLGSRSVGAGIAEADTRRDVVKDKFEAEMQRVGVSTGAPGFLGTSRGKAIVAGVVLLAILACAALIYALTYSKQVNAEVTGLTWTRVVELEEFRQVRDEAWEEDVPRDAYGVSCHREQRGTRKVAAGSHEECTDVDKGDGSFERQCRTVTDYRDEPVYDDRCTYTVDRWVPGRSVEASGSEASSLAWPQFSLAGGTYGKERERGRREVYTIVFRDADGEEHSCDVTEQSVWEQYAVGVEVAVEVGLTGSPDCDTLRPVG